jgi:anti-anti-sigma factor
MLVIDSCLVLEGELDAATTARLHREVAALEGIIDRIDLGSLRFIDSSGIRALLVVRRRYPKVAIVNPAPMARRLLDIVGVTEQVLAPPAPPTIDLRRAG